MPFTGDSPADVVSAVLGTPHVPAAELNPALPARLSRAHRARARQGSGRSLPVDRGSAATCGRSPRVRRRTAAPRHVLPGTRQAAAVGPLQRRARPRASHSACHRWPCWRWLVMHWRWPRRRRRPCRPDVPAGGPLHRGAAVQVAGGRPEGRGARVGHGRHADREAQHDRRARRAADQRGAATTAGCIRTRSRPGESSESMQWWTAASRQSGDRVRVTVRLTARLRRPAALGRRSSTSR